VQLLEYFFARIVARTFLFLDSIGFDLAFESMSSGVLTCGASFSDSDGVGLSMILLVIRGLCWSALDVLVGAVVVQRHGACWWNSISGRIESDSVVTGNLSHLLLVCILRPIRRLAAFTTSLTTLVVF